MEGGIKYQRAHGGVGWEGGETVVRAKQDHDCTTPGALQS